MRPAPLGFSINRLGSLALVAVGVLGAIAWHSSATNFRPYAPPPAVVGTINLEKLSGLLNEMKERNSTLTGRNQPRVDELKGLDAQLTQVKKELGELPPNTDRDKRMALTLKAIELEAMFDTKKRSYQQAAGIESGAVLRDMYLKIAATSKSFAEQNGYDLIILDDRGADLPENRSADDYGRIITGTKILFAKDTLDVTDALATQMNNEYTAGAGKPAAPAATGKATNPTPPAPAAGKKK